MTEQKKYVVPESEDGLRLDKVLESVVAGSSLRFRRRLCDEGKVLVGGRPRKPGYKVRSGVELEISGDSAEISLGDLGVYTVRRAGVFAAVFKPGGVHSASIAGKETLSVEAALPEMFDESALLLNRLDYLTSGLLLVALGRDGEKLYQEMEEAGEVRKYYRATVQGRFDGLVTVKNALDTDSRKKTRVLAEDDPDFRRWTDVEVVSHDNEAETTEVKCLIMKGARHQIRAHLASIGHPIIGDPVYGDGKEGDVLRLHHQRIEFPGFKANCDAEWGKA